MTPRQYRNDKCNEPRLSYSIPRRHGLLRLIMAAVFIIGGLSVWGGVQP